MTKGDKRSGQFKYLLGKSWLKLQGWEFEGELPPQGKFILICAPHTSNWDFTYLLAVMFMLRIQVSWLAKHTMFKQPFGRFLCWLGGIPVDRRSPHGVVDQIVGLFSKHEHLIIALAPENTRRKTDRWKSGFYHIACKAQVPLLLAYADYAKKRAGTGLSFLPSGDVKKDMDTIRAFYQDFRGANPEQASTIVLKEEQHER